MEAISIASIIFKPPSGRRTKAKNFGVWGSAPFVSQPGDFPGIHASFNSLRVLLNNF